MSGRDLQPETLLATEAALPAARPPLHVHPQPPVGGSPPRERATALGRPGDSCSPASAGEGRGEGPAGAVIGELLAFTDDGATALVLHPLHPGALRARSTMDLHGAHIGRPVVLLFEQGDVLRPLVMGVLHGGTTAPAAVQDRLEVDADGQRMVLTARNQLVLRCGKASITLTKAGKVLIEGTYVSSRSSGVNRVKGGSVQLN
jgi:hypothetical protein